MLKLKHKIYFIVILFLFAFNSCQDGRLNNFAPKADYFYKRAEQRYQDLLKNNPSDTRLFIDFASFYYLHRDYDKVIDLVKDQQDKDLLLIKAKAFAKLNKYTFALELFEDLDGSVNLKNDDEALYLYAQTCEDKNLFNKAFDIYSLIDNGSYKDKAQQRISSIKTTFKKETVPDYLQVFLSASISQTDYPEAGAVILSSNENIEVSSENTMTIDLHTIAKVLNDKGKEDMGEVLIEYDSTYERVELEFARTIRPDGTMLYAGDNNIRDVSKYLDFPMYSNVRVKIVSMPEVAKGSIIEYKAKIYRSKLVNDKDFSLIYPIAENYPVLNTKLNITVPSDREVNYKLVNEKYAFKGMDYMPKEITENNKKTLYWEFSNVPQLLPEAEMVPVSYVNPALLISTFSSWEDIYRWWRSLYVDKLAIDDNIKKKVDELVADEQNPYEQIRKIYEFCAKDIRYVALEYGRGGHEPHSAAEVFLNRYGDCKDQAILLVAMLRSLNYDASPVLIPTDDVYNLERDFPALYFNHAIAVVKINKELIFMDPTASTVSFRDIPTSDQDRNVLIFFEETPGLETIPIISKNILNVNMDIRINKNEKANFKREITSKGMYSAGRRYYFKYTQPSMIEEDIQKRMREISSVSKLDYYKIENKDDLNKDPVLVYEFIADNILSNVKNLRIMPVLTDSILGASFIAKEDRKYPLDLGGVYGLKIEADIHLPSNMRIKYLPDFVEINNKWLEFRSFYRGSGNAIKFLQVMAVKEKTIDPSEYKEFKKAMEKILYNLKQQIILEKI